MSRPTSIFTILVLILSVAPGGFASDLDDRLNQRLRGAWAVLEVEVYSACAGTSSDNEVGNAGVASKAPNRFEAGELVKIDKVNARQWRDGWNDGQELVFNVLLAQRLQACVVPVP